MPRTLEQIVSPYSHPPIVFFDNLNVDLITFDPELFWQAKRRTEQLGAEYVIITGNLFSTIGDHDTFARERDYVGAHLKRKVGQGKYEVKGYYNKELNTLDDKLNYVSELFKDWKIKQIYYILGSHDNTEIKIRTVAKLNDVINKFEMNMLRQLGDSSGRTEYFEAFMGWMQKKDEMLDFAEEQADPEKFEKKLKKLFKQFDKDYFGKKPVKQMKSKSDFDQDEIHKQFRGMEEQYRSELAAKISNLTVSGFNWEGTLYDDPFRVMASFSDRMPSINGFANTIGHVRRMITNRIELPKFMVQGMHGTFSYKAMRLRADTDEYLQLMQIPSFEVPQVGYKWKNLTTSALETSKRHAAINTALGVPVLYIGSETLPPLVGWMDRPFLMSNKNPNTLEYILKTGLGDNHTLHGNTREYMIRTAMAKIVEMNPDILSEGGDKISGGHYPGHTSNERFFAPPKETANKIKAILANGGTYADVQEYFEQFNHNLRNQNIVLNEMYTPFLEDILSLGNVRIITINDGHHDKLLLAKLGEQYSVGQQLFNKIKLHSAISNNYFDITPDGTQLCTGTLNGHEFQMVFNDDEVRVDNMYGHRFSRTHQRRGGGGHNGSITSSLQSILDNSELGNCNLGESEHYHTGEVVAIGPIYYISHMTFQGQTDYAKGTTDSKGAFGPSDEGFFASYLSEGPASFKLVQAWTSDILARLKKPLMSKAQRYGGVTL